MNKNHLYLLFFSVFAGLFFFRIGFAIAKQLTQDGAKVIVSSRKQDKVMDTVAQLEKLWNQVVM